jgi:hypothetical protein
LIATEDNKPFSIDARSISWASAAVAAWQDPGLMAWIASPPADTELSHWVRDGNDRFAIPVPLLAPLRRIMRLNSRSTHCFLTSSAPLPRRRRLSSVIGKSQCRGAPHFLPWGVKTAWRSPRAIVWVHWAQPAALWSTSREQGT